MMTREQVVEVCKYNIVSPATLRLIDVTDAALRQQLEYLAVTVEVLAKSEVTLKAELAAVRKERDLFKASRHERLNDYGEACDRERLLKQQLADLLAKLAQVEKELSHRKGWQHCKTHEKINADYAWGCPDCVHELRHQLAEAQGRVRELEALR